MDTNMKPRETINVVHMLSRTNSQVCICMHTLCIKPGFGRRQIRAFSYCFFELLKCNSPVQYLAGFKHYCCSCANHLETLLCVYAPPPPKKKNNTAFMKLFIIWNGLKWLRSYAWRYFSLYAACNIFHPVLYFLFLKFHISVLCCILPASALSDIFPIP